MNETESQHRARTLRAIALKCQRGLTDIHDAAALAQIADAIDPPAGAGPDSPSGDHAACAPI